MKKVILFLLLTGVLSLLNSQDVTSSGAFTYTYPIEIPAGTNGIQPNIALVYHSQSGNGMTGMGWTLTGFPTITRDSTYPVNWDSDDHFLYNGQRLIPDSDGYYHTENKSFEMIQYVNETYWVVTQQDGTELYFGNTADSKIEGIDKDAARVWALRKVLDVNGNYYLVDYDEDTENGDYYPEKVTYTMGNDLSTYKEISFSYEEREDHYATYYPSKIDLNKRLNKISISSDDKTIKYYELQYDDQTSNADPSKLCSLIEYGANGSTFSTIDFEWTEQEITLSPANWGNPEDASWNLYAIDGSNDDESVITLIDMNSDNLPDRVWKNNDMDYMAVALNNGNGFDSEEDWGNPEDASWNLYARDGGNDDELVISLLDINGDNLPDRIWKNNDMDYLAVALNNGSGFDSEENWGNPEGASWNLYAIDGSNDDESVITFIDMNADGLPDRVWKNNDMDYMAVALNNGNGFESEADWGNPEGASWNLYARDGGNDDERVITLIDMNADGLPDRVWKNNDMDYMAVALNNGSGFESEEDWGNPEGASWNLYARDGENDDELVITLIDMNADGLPDRVWKNNDMDYMAVALNNGSGFESEEDWGNPEGASWNLYAVDGSNDDESVITLIDMNGDNLPDRVWKNNDMDYLAVALNNGSGFDSAEDWGNPEDASWNLYARDGDNDDELVITLLDMNGDGRPDRVWKNGGDLYVSANTIEYSISEIMTSSGMTISPSYDFIANLPDALDTTDSSYPYISNCYPKRLLTSLTISDGYDQELTTTYNYYNGKYQTGYRDERKSLGFEWVEKTNPNGTTTKTYYYQEEEDALYAGLVEREEFYGSDGNIYSAVEYDYTYETIQSESDDYHSIKFISLQYEYGYTFEGATYTDWDSMKASSDVIITKKYYEYDSDLGTLYLLRDSGDVSHTRDDSGVVTVYVNDDSTNITVLKVKRTYAYPMDGSSDGLFETSNISSITGYCYDGNNSSWGEIGEKGLLTRINDLSGADDLSQYPNSNTWMTYDDYGNIKTITDALGNVSTVSYETDYNSSISSKENSLGQTIETNSYDEYGRLESTEDVNGNYTWYEYDEFHRVISQSNGDSSGPDRIISTTAYSNTDAPDDYPQWIKEEVYSPSSEDEENYITTYTYYDNFGNKLQTKSEGRNASGSTGWIGVSFYIDWETGESLASDPIFYSSSAYNSVTWSDIDHSASYQDEAGRNYLTTYPDGTSEYIKYGLNETYYLTQTADGDSLARYEVLDEGILKSYSYGESYLDYSDLDTMNTGDWTYMTETLGGSDGTRISETGADEGTTHTLETLTDYLGRKMSYTDPDMGTWYYEYDANGNMIKQTDGAGNVIEFEFDELNRVIQKDGADRVIYCYDGLNADGSDSSGDHGSDYLGRLTKVYYTSSDYWESYYYDDDNRTYKVTRSIDGLSRTSKTTLDEMGRVVEEITPEGETLTYEYNVDGSLNGLESSDYYYIDGLNYNLLGQIEDYTLGNGSTVDYDYNTENYLENILIENSSGSVLANMSFEYDEWGNITYKSFFDDYDSYYTENLTYDEYFRLESATSNGLYESKTYGYDDYNNLLEKDGYEYEYEGTGPHQVTAVKNSSGETVKTYEYDDNGNITKISGQSHIVIRAKGTGTTDNPPVMELWFNEEKTDYTWTVNSTEYQNYYWHGVIPDGATVDLVFTNQNDDGGTDTTLTIDYIEINDETVQSESAYATIDKGSYSSGCFDGSDVISGQETLEWTGAIRYFVSPDAEAAERVLYYDKENRLTSITDNGETTATYMYDPSGQRIRTIENGETTYYFFGNYEEVYASDTLESQTTYYFANGQRIAYKETKESDSEIYYYHQDHLGSSVRVTDSSGTPVQSLAYTPFGQICWFAGEEGNRITFTGQEADLTGFMYYNARYYDPELGRFLQADTMLDGLNRYTYCGNNPVIYNDPTGQFLNLGTAAIGAVVGAICGGVSAGIAAAADGGNIFDIAGAVIAGATAGAVTGGIHGFVGGPVGVVTGALASISIGT
ncbi:MAG: SpvB/TcaC N-terminal domain-containing protein, partial [Spirochaetales bacterium]|nr:SpvB/TcaC N-terminal domain-containing protein [Spirochaetales bacterium]